MTISACAALDILLRKSDYEAAHHMHVVLHTWRFQIQTHIGAHECYRERRYMVTVGVVESDNRQGSNTCVSLSLSWLRCPSPEIRCDQPKRGDGASGSDNERVNRTPRPQKADALTPPVNTNTGIANLPVGWKCRYLLAAAQRRMIPDAGWMISMT